MSLKFRSLTGIDNARIIGGLSVTEIPGDGGSGPQSFHVFLNVSGLVPGTGNLVLEAPTTFPTSAGPADSNGNIGLSVSWFNTGDDITYGQAGGSSGPIPDGFWQQIGLIRGSCSVPTSDIGVQISFSDSESETYNEDLTTSPSPPTPNDPQWDGDQGQVTLDITYDDTLAEDPDSIAIIRDGVTVASTPINPGQTDYQFTDIVFAAGSYDYEVFVYKYPDSRSAFSAPITVVFGGVASITMTMSGGITFGGSATIVFIGNPTGTYTLVKDKTNDTLYNTEEDVAIPNPFVITGFLP